MFKYSKDGVSVLSVLGARRVKKSGLFPIGHIDTKKQFKKYLSSCFFYKFGIISNIIKNKSHEFRNNLRNKRI